MPAVNWLYIRKTKMKTPISSLLLLLLLLLVLLTNSIQGDDDDLVEQICKKTPFYDLCISTLRSRSSGSSDVKDLACMMANILLANATDTLNYFRGQINQTSDPDMERALAYCAELYIPVVKYNLPQASEAINKCEFEFASEGISDAAKEADACEKKLSGSMNSPLSDRHNKLVHSLSDIALAILKLLPKPKA